MSTHLLLEAALRSVVMGAIIFVTLRLLRIEQVRAQRTAWLLALAGALAMPLLVAAQIGPRLLPEIAFAHRPSIEALTVALPSAPGGALRAQLGVGQYALGLDQRSYLDRRSSLEQPAYSADRPDKGDAADNRHAQDSKVDGARLTNTALLVAAIGYCAVASLLALRLFAGLGLALRLKNQARRVVFSFDPDLDTRASGRLATPVTIGSSVLLPKNYTLWDGATLRIVLSHERAHVRQKDFYVHMLAGLHCALFWFNPFSWWLQRQLSELGEALSDCAAVEQAESRASYAETLLAFATRDHWSKPSVAMASASNLTPRIERLLNEQGFERSFAPKQRLPFIAAGVVLLAMVASTSMVRVHAASQSPNAGSTRSSATSTTAQSASAADASTPAVQPTSPAIQPAKRTHKVRKQVVKVEVDDGDIGDAVANEEAVGNEEAERAAEEAEREVREADHAARDADRAARNADRASREADRESVRATEAATDEEVLAIRSGESHITINSGRLSDLQAPKGDYIYFQHNGKPYVIQDPQIIGKAQALLAPMKELSEKQKELGHQQAMLGAQQRMLAAQRRSIRIADSPEFKREMDDLQRRLKEIDLPRLTAQITSQIDQKALAEVQSHLGEIQARVGHLQAEFGSQGHQFGEQQGKLGEQQGKLGEQQALLGEQQRKIIEDTRRQLKPLIEQAIKEGKGKVISVE